MAIDFLNLSKTSRLKNSTTALTRHMILVSQNVEKEQGLPSFFH